MHTHEMHVDEISVWTWVATLAFALIAIMAIVVGTQDKMSLATTMNGGPLPVMQPSLDISNPRA